VLNFAIDKVTTEFVLVLSSHTVLTDPEAIATMQGALEDDRVAAVSAVWDDDPFYGQRIDWESLNWHGIKFGSIYTNSIGMIRHAAWQDLPFDECFNGSEDFAWALERCRRGDVIVRLPLIFDYRRKGPAPLIHNSASVKRFARLYKLPLNWLGCRTAVSRLVAHLGRRCLGRPSDRAAAKVIRQRLLGALFWRWLS
jgi:hypothetical protein